MAKEKVAGRNRDLVCLELRLLTQSGRSGICRRRLTGAHVPEVTALWLNVAVVLAANDTVEMQGNFTGDGESVASAKMRGFLL